MPLHDAPPTRFSVRAATTADLPALVAIVQGAFHEYLGKLDPPSGAHAESPASMLRLLRTEHVLLAESKAQGRVEAVGCVFFAPNERRAPPGVREVYLHRLAVLPAWRRLGIATRLMADAETWATDAGFESVALGVRVALPANRRFYEALGYRVSEYTTHAGYSQSTAMIMRKRLVAPPLVEVALHEWSPAWAEQYERAATQLRHLLGGELVATFHVGSTAVRGLAARPCIDIMAVVRSLDAMEARDETLLRAGWQPQGLLTSGARHYLRGEAWRPTHQLYAYRTGNAAISGHLALPAWLAATPGAAAELDEAKRLLAAQHRRQPKAYVAGLEHLLQPLQAEALRWWQAWRAS